MSKNIDTCVWTFSYNYKDNSIHKDIPVSVHKFMFTPNHIIELNSNDFDSVELYFLEVNFWRGWVYNTFIVVNQLFALTQNTDSLHIMFFAGRR